MRSDHGSLADGVQLARSVRSLAIEARRVLGHPPNILEAQELLEHLDDLEEESRTRGSENLSNWLASLRKRLEDHVMALA
jgi:hypothetical protein